MTRIRVRRAISSPERLGGRTIYIIVHPDDFALNLSSHIESPQSYKRRLTKRIRNLLVDGVDVVLVNLATGDTYCPEFMMVFKEKITIIPAYEDDTTDAQAFRLRAFLSGQPGVGRLIFTGGWKNACLKHTINHTLSDFERVRFVDRIDAPFQASIRHCGRILPVQVEIDQDFVF